MVSERKSSAPDAGYAGESGVRGDGANGEHGTVLADRVEHHTGVEPVAEHERCRDEQREDAMPDQSGDVEQRREPEDRLIRAELHPFAVAAGVEDEVRVRELGALGIARRARGVDEERDVVRTRFGCADRQPSGVSGQQVGQVVRALDHAPPALTERARVVAGLPVER